MKNFLAFISCRFRELLPGLSIILFLVLTTQGQKPCDSFDILANVLNDGGESKIQRRHIFARLDEKCFDVEHLRRTFEKMSALHPEPYNLRITFFSDDQELKKLLRFEASIWAIDFKNDEAGKKAERDFYDRQYPKPSGYFRAVYYRYGSHEFFDFSLKKELPETKRVNLKLH